MREKNSTSKKQLYNNYFHSASLTKNKTANNIASTIKFFVKFHIMMRAKVNTFYSNSE